MSPPPHDGRCLQVIKLSFLHCVLYTCVVLYLYIGAHVFLRLEGDVDARQEMQEEMERVVGEIAKYHEFQPTRAKWELLGFVGKMQKAGVSADELKYLNKESESKGRGLQLADCVLFVFTIVSTIGMVMD